MLRNLRNSFAVKPVVNVKPFEFMSLLPECNVDVFKVFSVDILWASKERMMTYCRTSDFFRGTDFALCFSPSISRLARPKDLRQLLRRIHDYVRNRLLEGMRSEPIGHAYRPQPGIATSADIDVRIANNRGVLWRHAVFFQQFS